MHHCDSWRIKDQLDVTCYFISLLMCSACFGHLYIHHRELATMLLNYHTGRYVLGSLCVGDSVWLGWSGIRVAGWSRPCAYEHTACFTAPQDTSHHIKCWKSYRVIYGLELLKTGIMMPETYWANVLLIYNNCCIQLVSHVISYQGCTVTRT